MRARFRAIRRSTLAVAIVFVGLLALYVALPDVASPSSSGVRLPTPSSGYGYQLVPTGSPTPTPTRTPTVAPTPSPASSTTGTPSPTASPTTLPSLLPVRSSTATPSTTATP